MKKEKKKLCPYFSKVRISKELTFKRVEFSGIKVPMLDFVLTKKDLKKLGW